MLATDAEHLPSSAIQAALSGFALPLMENKLLHPVGGWGGGGVPSGFDG